MTNSNLRNVIENVEDSKKDMGEDGISKNKIKKDSINKNNMSNEEKENDIVDV
jgi:hypothetical protein